MPKQIHKIEQFHGGLSSNSDPRDINDTELSSATDVMVDEVGKVRMMGDGKYTAGLPYAGSTTIEDGYGLFHAAFDWSMFSRMTIDASEDHGHPGGSPAIAAGDTITGAASGATAYVVKNYANVLYLINYRKGDSTVHDSPSYNDSIMHSRGFLYSENHANYGPLIGGGTEITLQDTHYNITTANGTPAIYVHNPAGYHGIQDGSYIETVESATVFDLNQATNATHSTNFWDEVILREKVTGDISGGSAMVNSVVTYPEYSGTSCYFLQDQDKVHLYDANLSTAPLYWFENVITLSADIVDTELMACDAANNRTFDSDEGNWVALDATGADVALAVVSNKLQVTTTTDNEIEGAQLPITRISTNCGTTTIVAGRTYRVSVDLDVDAGTPTMYVGLGGTLSSSFDISTSETTYTKDIVPVNKTGALKIYNTSSTALVFTIDNVSVKELGTKDNVQPTFYVADGIMRVSDGNHLNWRNFTKFFGYIPSKQRGSHFLTNWETEAGWFSGDAEVVGLSSGQFSNFGTGIVSSQSYDWSGGDGGFELFLDHDGDTPQGVLWDGFWKAGLTFIYDDGQESDLMENAVEVELGSSKMTTIGLTWRLKTPNGGGAIPERVEKIGVYLQETGSTEWWYQGEADLKLGGMKYLSSLRTPWKDLSITHDDRDLQYRYTNLIDHIPDGAADLFTTGPALVSTFKDRTGREVGDPTSATFKSAIVANRMVYAANIQQDSEVFGDRIIKSPVNKFDIFSSKRLIEATINDGDEIVAIQSYADRILEFKKSKMTIINVSQEIEFLEETFPFKGISSPTAVCKTDYGVAWVNANGCFLFDGKQVTDLLDKGGLQKIKESDWQSFITDTSMIGFYPKKKQLIVVKDTSTASDGDIYLFDMVTGSWVQGDSKLTDSIDYTNFINNILTGDLVYAANTGTSTFYSWRDTAQSSSAVSFQTKDIDFGQPAQRKKVYKVYISYKGDGSSVTVKYGVNGETDASDLYAFDSANLADKSSAENLETWHLAELKPGTSSQSNNIYSFQIVFDGTAAADFEINDISIVYRLKNVR